MGTYFNPSNESFVKDINNDIYIDKTGLLKYTNNMIGKSKNCISLSHARRFGKSQVAGMIDAYYSSGSDSKELFSKFEISKSPDFEKHLNKYNVIHLDISSFADFYKEELVDKVIEYLYDEFRVVYPEIDYKKSINAVIMQIAEKSNMKFVIVIDEWDCVVRNHADAPEIVHKYMQFLHTLFKSEESKKFLSLGYITGILPIKKIKDESALNNFREYTMVNSKELTRYFGFTEEEVKDLCKKYDMNFESVKEWYNGYLINGMHMYNPNSVYNSMIDHDLCSYWRNTSSFASINQYITLDHDGLKEDVMEMLNGGRVSVDTETFQNDLSCIESKDDALTALIHLGYLGYDAQEREAYIPNYEVATAFHSALKKGKWSEVANMLMRCDSILNATIRRNEEKVAELIELSHETHTSVLKYNDENALSCAITMAYFTAPAYYTVIREFPNGKGFADIVLIPRADSGNKPAMVIELKWNKNADTAIKQIKENRYSGKLSGYGKEVLLVGINYSKKTKKHTCIIESIDKINNFI